MRLQGIISKQILNYRNSIDIEIVDNEKKKKQVMECHWWGKCPSTTQACTWDTAFDWHDCQSMHAICTRGNGGAGSGTCRWSHSKSYRQCSKKRAGSSSSDPKNPDDPARSASSPVAGISAVSTSSSRRWKNNLLLKSWRCATNKQQHHSSI